MFAHADTYLCERNCVGDTVCHECGSRRLRSDFMALVLSSFFCGSCDTMPISEAGCIEQISFSTCLCLPGSEIPSISFLPGSSQCWLSNNLGPRADMARAFPNKPSPQP